MFISKKEYRIFKNFEHQAKELAKECEKLEREKRELEEIKLLVQDAQNKEQRRQQELWSNFWNYDGTPQEGATK